MNSMVHATLALLLVISTSSMATAAPSPACQVDHKLADLVAGSDVVLFGTMEVAKERLGEESRKPSPNYLDIPVRVTAVVKGRDMKRVTLRFFPKDAAYKPSNDAVLKLAGAPALLFLAQTDEDPVGLYFAGASPEALQPATEPAVGAAQAEVARQSEIRRAWRQVTSLPRYGEVQALIARLGEVGDAEQQETFDRLEALGTEAVPAIVAQMDDRRPLRTRAITLKNHAADAFEASRQYRPEQVVDSLDAVLNQLTGASFGSISNGGSDRDRDAAVAGWRVYAADLACRQAP